MNKSSVKKNAYLLLIVLILLIGATYAWFTLTINNSKTNIIRAGKLKINLVDCEKDLVLKNAVPVSDNKGMQSEVCTFKVENTGTTSIDYSVYLDDTDELTTDERMNDKYVKFGLIKNDGDPKIGELPTTGVNPDRVLTSEKISGSTTDTYKLRVWINQDADNGVMGTIFSGKVRVDATQSKPPAANLKAIDKTQTISSVVFQVVNDTPTNTANTNNKAKVKKLDNKKNAEVVKVASMKSQAAASYDVSVEQDKSVMQYNVLNEDGTTYTAYIEASKKIVAPEDSSGLLSGSSITSITGLENLDTSQVVSMRNFFSHIRVNILDVSSLNTSNVTDMSSMFYGSSIPSIDMSMLDASNVLSMASMFASSNIPSINLSGLDASKVTTMKQMFTSSNVNSIDLSKLNVSSVTDMSFMFYQTANLSTLNIDDINTSSATNMSFMFYGTGLSSIDLSLLDTSKVTNMGRMFATTKNMESLDFSVVDVSKVTSIESLIADSNVKELNLTGLSWDSTDGSYMNGINAMLSSASNLEVLDANNMSIPRVTMLGYTGASGWTDLKSIKYINMNHLNAPNLTGLGRIVPYYNTTGVVQTELIDLSYMNAPKLESMTKFLSEGLVKNVNLSHFVDTSNLTDMSYAFEYTPILENIDLTGTSTANVRNISYMFNNSGISSFDFSQLDTSSVTDISLFLSNAYRLTTVDLSSFDNSHSYYNSGGALYLRAVENLNLHGLEFSGNVYGDISYMSALKNLDMSDMKVDYLPNLSNKPITTVNFSNTVVTSASYASMSSMFEGDTLLTTVNMENLNAPNVMDLSKMFYGATSLTDLNMSGMQLGKIYSLEKTFANTGLTGKLDLTWVDATNLMSISNFISGSSFTEIDMSGWQLNQFNSLSGLFSNITSLNTISLNNFNGPKVTDISGMFSGTTGLQTLNLDGIKLGKVETINGMFSGSGLTGKLDMTWLDASELTSVGGAYAGTVLSEIDMSGWQASKLSSLSGMFQGATKLTKINMSNSSYSSLEGISYGVFSGVGLNSLQTVDLSNSDFSKVTSMSDMFNGNVALTDVNISGIKTGSLTDISQMLTGTTALTSFDFKSLDLSNVTNMIGIVNGSGITSVNLDNVDISALTTLNRAFYGASKLKTFSMKNAKAANVTDIIEMFNGASLLTTVDMSGTVMDKLAHTDYWFKDCAALKNVDISSVTLSTDLVEDEEQSNGYLFENVPSGLTVKVKDAKAKEFVDAQFDFCDMTGTAIIA